MFLSLKISVAILCFLYAFSIYALPEDKQQKVYIVSDASIYNYRTGISVFEGHVRIDQGSTHITADRLITKNNDQHKMQEAIAYGFTTLAHYWTLQKPDAPEIHAYAKIIKFYPLNSNVTLEENVLVRQGENVFRGQLIHYNKNDQTIIVPPSKDGGAVLVYHPDK